jgi:hypothetical protein
MRYVAKIHVLDVMDQVVVSGYVHEWPDYPSDSPEIVEFTFTTPGVGLSDPYAWLLNSLYRALVTETDRLGKGSTSRPVTGGTNTISETGDTGRSAVG